MVRRFSRRQFIQTSALAAAGIGVWSELPAAESKSPNERLDIACIGVYNRAGANIDGVASQNIVALCDIDDLYLAGVAKRFPQAKTYNDFRKLLDIEKTIDAVVVSTPDHIHAPASAWAMQLGKHVYCEKPLTHSVYEARMVAGLAKRNKLATQLGTQIHAGSNYRRVVEVIQSGTLGTVSEVHVWVNKVWGGGQRPTENPEIPGNIHWDLWLGPAPARPYHPTYLPASWRRWWDFGGGTLGDMGCHYMDLPFWALNLRHPTTIEAEGAPRSIETYPVGMVVRYEFPAAAERPPIKLTWYDGNHVPRGRKLGLHTVGGDGVLFVGDKGQMYANYGEYKLYPEDQFRDFVPPKQTIPDSEGHYIEWIKACKEGTPTTCNFDYSGALTEAVLLGNVAFRTGTRIDWDAEQLQATNCPEAAQVVRREYRPGWVDKRSPPRPF